MLTSRAKANKLENCLSRNSYYARDDSRPGLGFHRVPFSSQGDIAPRFLTPLGVARL
jgi:hypothetical protein